MVIDTSSLVALARCRSLPLLYCGNDLANIDIPRVVLG
jgi:uncharacterized protein with PIN domain